MRRKKETKKNDWNGLKNWKELINNETGKPHNLLQYHVGDRLSFTLNIGYTREKTKIGTTVVAQGQWNDMYE